MKKCKCSINSAFRWREQPPRPSIFLATPSVEAHFGGANLARADAARLSAEKNAALFYANLPHPNINSERVARQELEALEVAWDSKTRNADRML